MGFTGPQRDGVQGAELPERGGGCALRPRVHAARRERRGRHLREAREVAPAGLGIVPGILRTNHGWSGGDPFLHLLPRNVLEGVGIALGERCDMPQLGQHATAAKHALGAGMRGLGCDEVSTSVRHKSCGCNVSLPILRFFLQNQPINKSTPETASRHSQIGHVHHSEAPAKIKSFSERGMLRREESTSRRSAGWPLFWFLGARFAIADTSAMTRRAQPASGLWCGGPPHQNDRPLLRGAPRRICGLNSAARVSSF